MANEQKHQKLSELINPTPQQLVAFEALRNYKYILYGGAMGGGKSYWLRWAVVVLLISFTRRFGVRGVYAGIFCEDYRTLEDRQISKVKTEFPRWLGTLNKSNHEFTLSEKYGSHIIAFRNLDDPGKYDSAEFGIIAVDELTKNPETIFGTLRRRLRWPGIPGSELRFIGGTNPGGIGHGWVKKLFILKEYDPNEQEKEQFHYIQAKATDNPHLDKNYLITLQSMPEKERKAYLEGDWDIFAGQFFSKEWSREWNVCEPFPIPDWWPKFICLDYGYSAPSAVYWIAISPFGQLYAYRELYGTGMTYKQLGKAVVDLTPKEEKIDFVVADPAIFSKGGHQDIDDEPRSGADELSEGMNGRFVVIKANNDRINGWGIMRQYMSPKMYDEKKSSRLIFFSTCKNAIRTIPALIHDDVKAEDVDCFIAGTMISTINGDIPVEEIKSGDLIYTPIGYHKAYIVGEPKEADIIKVTLENGKSIEGTQYHKVFVYGKGLVGLQYLCCDDILLEKSNATICDVKKSSTEVSYTEDTKTEGITSQTEQGCQKVEHHSIDKFGLITSERYRRAFMFITRIMTSTITLSKILLWSRLENMHYYTTEKEWRAESYQTFSRNGVIVKKERRYYVQMLLKCWKELLGGNLRVEIVESLLRQNTQQLFYAKSAKTSKGFIKRFVKSVVLSLCKRKTVVEQHKLVRILAVGKCERKEVYRLRVEEAHLYYANGILSTNTDGEDHSGDSIRYGIMYVHDEDKANEPERPRKGRRNANDIFEDDMLYLKNKKEEEGVDPDWMNI